MKAKTSRILLSIFSLALLGYGCAPPLAQRATQPLTTEPSPAPYPFSDKNILISLIKSASDGMDEISACLNGYDTYRFVLTRDGHLIRFDEGIYVKTKISQVEIDRLMSEIEATDFFALTGNGDQYIQNAPSPSFENPWGGSITVDDKTVAVTPGQSDYLVEPVIKTLEIIENYKPNELRLYTPVRIKLWVFREEDFGLGTANPTPEPPVLKWSLEDMNLENLLTGFATSKPQIISGETLSFLMGQLKHVPVVRKAEQNAQTYYVLGCPIFSDK